jgi:transposase, IS30 family
MPRGGQNRMPVQAKRRYFELIREGRTGTAASREVGVSTSCGSKWFIQAGGVLLADQPVSPRLLTQDDRIAIADALYAGQNVKTIATLISKSFQTVYREIKRNSKPDGSYHPWWAHNQALQRRQRPKPGKLAAHGQLRETVTVKLKRRWSPQQISRFLTRLHPDQPAMRVCTETIYRGLYDGTVGTKAGKLRTGRTVRKAQRRGVTPPNKIKT